MKKVYLSPSGILLIGILLVMLIALFAGIAQLRRNNKPAMFFWRKVLISYLLIVVAICTLSVFGFFNNPDIPPKFAPVFIAIFATVIFLLIKAKGKLILLTDKGIVFLIALHVYRILMELLLVMLYGENIIPKEITWHGFNFDVIIGITAPIFAIIYARSPEKAKAAVLIWNVLGIISLLNIMVMAILSIDLPIRMFSLNSLPHYFPGILIPAFLFPLALYLHIITIKAIRARFKQKY
jgi:hypothetical protein